MLLCAPYSSRLHNPPPPSGTNEWNVRVESDHVEGGRDSNSYGAVPLGLITGKVTAIVWPKERVGWIENKVDEKRVLSTIRSA